MYLVGVSLCNSITTHIASVPTFRISVNVYKKVEMH